MLLILLKSSACLAVFMLFYKLCLEKTSAHTFKRFYLIGIILFSIAIPFITFTEYIEIEPVSLIPNSEFTTLPIIHSTEVLTQKNYLPIILWSIYSIGVLLFSLRFFKNLYQLIQKIKKNPKFKNEKFINVLLQDLIHPHTFFNYIFFNKTKYEHSQIPDSVILHEQTHAKQKHAVDILLIEILQILFWFNPLLHFIKKDIKLNHEFLADQAVINNGVNTQDYQQLLLAFSSSASHSSLANAINYSLIKKRFTVMKTKTSKTVLWIRSLVLLPLLAILIYSFSSNKKVEKYNASENSNINHTARSIAIEVLENGTYKIDDMFATKETFISTINKLHQDITPEIRNRIINMHINNHKKVSDEDVWFIYNAALDYGFHRIVTYNQEIIRAKGNKPFSIKSSDKQNGATKKQVAEYNALAKKYNKQPQNKRIIKLKDIKRLEYLYGLMTKEQKANAESFPNCPPPPPKPPHVKKGEPSEIPPPPRYEEPNHNTKIVEIRIHIDDDKNLKLNNKNVLFKNLKKEVNKLNPDLSTEQKQKYLGGSLYYNKNMSEYAESIKDYLTKNCHVTHWHMSNMLNPKKTNHKLYLSNLYVDKTINEADKIFDSIHTEFLKSHPKAKNFSRKILSTVKYTN